jgi:hypothetical protein
LVQPPSFSWPYWLRICQRGRPSATVPDGSPSPREAANALKSSVEVMPRLPACVRWQRRSMPAGTI